MDQLRNKNNSRFILGSCVGFIFVIEPFVITLLYLYIVNPQFRFWDSYPFYSDEWGYWKQIEAIVDGGGRPYGFWGINGQHASLGHFSAHGIATLLPYALVGKVFGYTYNTTILCSVYISVVANSLFLIITRPRLQSLIRLILIQPFLYIRFQYSVTGMMELLRFSLAIILCGMIINCITKPSKSLTKVVFFLFFFYAIQCYLLFIVLTPIFVWITFFYSKRNNRSVASISTYLITCLLSAFISYKLFDTVVTHPKVSIASRLEDFWSGPGLIFGQLIDNVKEFFLIIISKPIYISIIGLYIFIMLWCCFGMIKDHTVTKSMYAIAFFFLTSSLIGYLSVAYSGSFWTTARGLYVAVVFSIYTLAYCCNSNDTYVLLVFTTYSALTFRLNFEVWKDVIISDRFRSNSVIADEVDTAREALGIKLNYSLENEWDYTVSLYTKNVDAYQTIIFALPSELGIMYMGDRSIEPTSQWVLAENELHWYNKKYVFIRSYKDISIFCKKR